MNNNNKTIRTQSTATFAPFKIEVRRNKSPRSFLDKMDDAGGFDVDIWKWIMRNRWCSLSERTVNGRYSSVGHKPQSKSYHDRSVTIEMTKEEYMDWVMSPAVVEQAIWFYSHRINPDIDRIDDAEGYSVSNIQLLNHHLNVEKRFGHPCAWKSDEELEAIRPYNYRSNRRSYIKSKISELNFGEN